MLDEQLGGRGELDAAAGLAQQRNPDLALEQGELLRDRRRALVQRLGHRCEGAAEAELAQQAQAADVEHRSGLLTDIL